MSVIGKKFIEEFIELYRRQTSLWQTKSDGYKNKNLKIKSWQILLDKFQEIDSKATIELVKKKIASFRTTYKRELVKVISSEKPGADPDDIYTPSLWYFDLLNFLRDQDQAEGTTTIEEIEGMHRRPQRRIARLRHSLAKRHHVPAKKRKREDSEGDSSKKTPIYLERATNRFERDDAKIFADGWAAVFRKLDARQQIFAKRLIDDALMQGQLGQLNIMCNISQPEGNHKFQNPHCTTRRKYAQRNLPQYIEVQSPNPTNSRSPSSSPTTIEQVRPPSHSSQQSAPSPQPLLFISTENNSEINSFQKLFNNNEYQ